jgi:ubiquinone/menaquinone biosynthesis C-methylase UbiE
MSSAVILAVALTLSSSAQDFKAEPGAPAGAFPKPDRPVADIVSPTWHNEKERDDAGEPRQVVRLLGIKSGMTVADIGAGSGYYVVRLSPIVGPRGLIIAQDVVPEYLRGLRSRVRDLGLQNVVISLGEPHDPRLPADSLDIAILVHMYHEIAQPYGLLYNLVPALKPGARVGLSTPTGRRRSMVPRQAFWAVSLQQWGIARSASIGSWAAKPISRSSHRHQSQAAHGRTLWSRARHHSRLPIRATGLR